MQDKTKEVFLQRLRTHSPGSNSPPSGLTCYSATNMLFKHKRKLYSYFQSINLKTVTCKVT